MKATGGPARPGSWRRPPGAVSTATAAACVGRVAVDAGGDGGEGDRPGAELVGHLQRPPVARRQQLGLARRRRPATRGRRCGSPSGRAAGSRAWPWRRPVRHPPRSRQAASSSGPAARWMAPSTPPPPSSDELAALTMASTSSAVMSPSTPSTPHRADCPRSALAPPACLEQDDIGVITSTSNGRAPATRREGSSRWSNDEGTGSISVTAHGSGRPTASASTPTSSSPSGGRRRGRPRRCAGAASSASECLEYALVNGEKFGIWGGLSERERRRIRRERTIASREAAATA